VQDAKTETPTATPALNVQKRFARGFNCRSDFYLIHTAGFLQS